ncbi:MAG: YfhO family protein [Thermomicrobiales bacterium]
MEPAIIAILANARATFLDLEQIPVYNPVHYQVYVDYIEVMNGAAQDYHYLDVMAPALGGSQLLDMLNVRYVLVPRAVTPQPPIAESGTIAYEDDLIVVYENPDAFPRAWIVHNVQPSMDGAELELLNSDQVDGRYTAFVDGDLPPVSLPANGPNSDVVTFNRHDPEFISVESNTGGDGLLVFSEVYDKGWNAYVNGEKVDLLRTNHALRGVPVPAGEHTVELKYEPIELRIGLWSTGIASLAMLAIWVWAGVDRFRHRPTVVPEVGP